MKKNILFISLLLLASGFAADHNEDVVSSLRSRIASFNNIYKRVKLDLFFNQPKYSPGDTAFFRTLYLTAADLKPVAGREIVYIEIFDQQGNRIIKNQFLVKNGWASNQLAIPENLPPAIYLITAYSEWMRNFDPALFFQQDFIVTGRKTLKEKTLGRDEIKLKFYPEGGTLISGVENNLVLQADGGGGGAEVIVKSETSEVARTVLDADGLAELKITPVPGVRYQAEFTADPARKFDLPAPKTEGLAIQTSQSDVVHVRIQPAAATDLTVAKYFFLLCNREGLVFSRKLEFTGHQPLEFSLPSGLADGIAQLSVVDESSKIWLQRTVYIQGNTEPKVTVQPRQKTYSTREGVTVEIEVVDNLGNAIHGNFASRVIRPKMFGDSTGHSQLADNLLVYSDIAARNKLSRNGLDQRTVQRYLITQSCPWLNWEKVLSLNSTRPRYSPKGNITLSGKVVLSESGKPVADSTQVMFFLQKQIVGYEIYTDAKGSFNFPVLFDFAGKDQVFYAASRKGRDVSDITIQLDKQDTNFAFKSRPWVATEVDDEYGFFSYQKSIIDKSFSFYSRNAHDKDVRDSVFDRNIFIEDELQGADVVLKVSDYNLFPTMAELIREVLRAVDYRNIRGKEIVRVYTTNKLPTNFAGPLYVIDGVPTKETSLFLSLKPVDVITIKVIKSAGKLIKFGTLGANGVLLVRTKLNKRIVDDHTFPVTGLLPGLKASENDIAPNRAQRAPDLRTCLYWNAQTTLDANGKAVIHFNTSDDSGTFQLHIEGMTSGGIPFAKEAEFKVSYEPRP